MKDDEDLSLPISTPTAHLLSSSPNKRQPYMGMFSRGRYKFWVLAAILLLAFWSMLTGTVTLRWSAGNLNRFSDDVDNIINDDLDVLEMEDRDKLVKHMWDVYTNSKRIRLPKFWQQAFESAYEDLTGDDPQIKENAFSEIAKMSLRYINLEPPPHFASSIIRGSGRIETGTSSNDISKG